MLRPKQLLPLYNGARAWLVAGTYKSTSLDDSHGSEASHFDDKGEKEEHFFTRASSNISEGSQRGNLSHGEISAHHSAEAYNGTAFTSSSKERIPLEGDSILRAHAIHTSFVDNFIQVPISSDNASKRLFPRAGAAVDPSVPFRVLEGSCSIISPSVRDRTEIFNEDTPDKKEMTLANRVCKVGMTAAGKFFELRDSLGTGKRGDATLFMVQRTGSSSTSNIPRQKSKSDSAGRSYTSSVTSEGNAPGFSYGGPSGGRRGPNFSNAHKDVRKFSSCTQPSGTGEEFSSPLNVLNDGFNNMKISPQVLVPQTPNKGAMNGQKNRRVREGLERQPPLASSHVEVAHDGMSFLKQNDNTQGASSRQVKSECHLAVQGTSRQGEPWRGVQQTHHRVGGSRHGRGALSAQRGFHNDGRETVDHVCNILKQLKWSPDTEDALSQLDRKLSPYHINEILKQQQDVGLALGFFDWAKKQDGFKHDVHTYTTMVGILGRVRRFDAISNLLEDMAREGCEPSIVTFNRLIHCYGRANQMAEALQIFHHMQQVGCSPDKVTYCTLIDLHAKAGFLDVAMDMYRQMQQAGLQPDTFTYSVIINCLGKAGEVSSAHKVFSEMIDKGCTPNLVTYNIVIDLHAKSGKYEMALKLYNDMQETGFRPDKVTYSIIMEVLGHVGHPEEAEYVFAEMQEAGWAPDMTVYGLLVDMWGKAGNVAKACEWYSKMLDSGIMPNVPTCNSLLGAFLRENLYDAGKQVLQDMLNWGLTPSLQTYTLLLDCYTMSQGQLVCELLWNLLVSTSHIAHTFLCSLPAVKLDGKDTREHATTFFNGICCETLESKRSFTDALINFLHKFNMKAEAAIVWEVATEKKIYPKAVTKKAPKYWAINLHTMSTGTAVVALSRTLSNLKDRMLTTGIVPERIDIITGWGRRSRVTGSSLVKQAVEEILQTVKSPFHLENGNLGCFVGIGKPLADWLYESDMEQMHLIYSQ